MTDDHRRDMDVLQQIIVRLAREQRDEEPRVIRAHLEELMHREGLDTGATKWLDDTASEIAAGRVVVTDAFHDVRLPDDRDILEGEGVEVADQTVRADESRA